MSARKLTALVAAIVPLGLAAPVAGARADTPAPAPAPASTAGPMISFVPPKVGPLQVVIGGTYIGGQLISAGTNVSTPGVSLPPMVMSVPSS